MTRRCDRRAGVGTFLSPHHQRVSAPARSDDRRPYAVTDPEESPCVTGVVCSFLVVGPLPLRHWPSRPPRSPSRDLPIHTMPARGRAVARGWAAGRRADHLSRRCGHDRTRRCVPHLVRQTGRRRRSDGRSSATSPVTCRRRTGDINKDLPEHEWQDRWRHHVRTPGRRPLQASASANLSDDQIQTVVANNISAGRLPKSANAIYLVLTSSDVSKPRLPSPTTAAGTASPRLAAPAIKFRLHRRPPPGRRCRPARPRSRRRTAMPAPTRWSAPSPTNWMKRLPIRR